ncbi:MAG: hypothetical protein KC643_29200 [Nitrospira sp.]|nr:hypothetical protein [Nitrospira sp.]
MSNKLPAEVAKQVKEIVYEAADNVDYLAMARTDSGKFLKSLVEKKEVGGVISQYVNKPEVRHYIKDAILNRYSKDKTGDAIPKDIRSIIKNEYGFDSEESHKEEKLRLFRAVGHGHEGEYVVVSDGTMLKWETALRRALLFIAGNLFTHKAKRINILLMLFAQHKKVTPSDKKHLEKALAISDAKPVVFGDK